MKLLLVALPVCLVVAVAAGCHTYRKHASAHNKSIVASVLPSASVVPPDSAPRGLDVPPVPRGPDLVEVEPTMIAYDFSGDVPVFEYAVVNGRRTRQPPTLNRRGDYVYYCQRDDLDEFQGFREIRPKSWPYNPPSTNSSSGSSSPPRSRSFGDFPTLPERHVPPAPKI